jgi:putative aldouronate transport system substrate-binding protein
MKISIRSASALLAVSALMAIMAACSKEQDAQAPPVTSANFNATGFPIVKEKVTLNFFIAKMAVAGPLEDMQVLKDYEAKTNVHINWSAVPQENAEEKKNLLFAGNDLPDAFMNALKPKDEVLYGSQKLLVPLNQLIEQYAPNIKKMFADHPDVKKAITTTDGNIYGLPQYFEQPDHVRIPDKFYINVAWLQKLNLTMPKTTDELYTVLKAFKTGDPNGNGKADEVPMLFYNAAPNASVVDYYSFNNFFSLFSAFGITDYFMVKDGKVTAGFMQEGYKDALKFTAKLYAEKLLDNESFTMNEAQARAKGSAKDSVAGSFSKMAEFQLVGNDKVKDYDVIPPLKGPKGDQVYRVFPTASLKAMFAITKVNKNPEATIRWIDYAYSDMGGLEFSAGPENVSWKWNDKDKQIIENINPPKDVTFAEFRHKHTLGAMTPYYRSSTIKSVENAQQIRLGAQAKKYFGFMPKEIFPDVYVASGDAQKRAELATTISPYVQMMMAKFISGQASVDSEWDNYLATLKKMGMDDLLKIQQASYDVYLKAK